MKSSEAGKTRVLQAGSAMRKKLGRGPRGPPSTWRGTKEPVLTSPPGGVWALEAAVRDLEKLVFRSSNQWGQPWRSPTLHSASRQVTGSLGALPPPAQAPCGGPASQGLPPSAADPSSPGTPAAELNLVLSATPASPVPFNGGAWEISGGRFGATQQLW